MANKVLKIIKTTPMQSGLLFHNLINEEEIRNYYCQINLRLVGEVNARLLFKAWQEITNRYEIFRTDFRWKESKSVVQLILEHKDAEVYEFDLRGRESGEQQSFITRYREEDLARRFDFEKGKLSRLTLIRLQHEEYYLIWTFHHILFDGWSRSVIMEDFFQVYASLCKNEPLPPAPQVQFSDYVNWLGKLDYAKGEQYWQEYMEGFQGPTYLSMKRGKRKDEVVESALFADVVFDEAETRKIKAFCQEQQITVNALFQTVWALLLQKYHNTRQSCVGMTVSGRNAPIKDIEKIVGLLINSLPVVLQTLERDTVADLLVRVNSRIVEIQEYDYISLADIQKYAGTGEDLFDVLIAFENFPDLAGQVNKNEYFEVIWDSTYELAHYDVIVAIMCTETILMKLSFNQARFTALQVQRIQQGFANLLRAIMADSTQQVRELEVLGEAEREHWLYTFNQTIATYPAEKTVVQLFAEQVARAPEAIAIVDADESGVEAKAGPGESAVERGSSQVERRREVARHSEPSSLEAEEGQGQSGTAWGGRRVWSYRELDERSNQIAALLVKKGVRPDEIIGLYVERSFAALVGILGVLKAGGAYLPIDPAYPEERIQYILQESGVRLVLTQSQLNGKIRFAGEMLDLDQDGQDQEGLFQEEQYSGALFKVEPFVGGTSPGEHRDLLSRATPDNLAYVIYTSGSTGRPKGIMVEHRGLVNYLTWASKVYMNSGESCFPLYSSLSFDLTVTSIFLPLLTGKTIVVYRDDENEQTIMRIIQDNLVDIIKLTPAHLRLINELRFTNSRLKTMIVGGESLKTGLARSIHEKFGGQVAIYNEYGPTETVVGCMIYRYDPAEEVSESVPIGRPADNVQIYLLDQDLHPVEMGIPGEIYISGDGVARGYLNQPELTAERFLANPFLSGRRMYKTGDLAQRLESGDLEFLRRIDGQVKLRGFRIEIGEIENQLLRYPGVQDVAVLLREDSADDQVLVAYFTYKNEVRETLEDARDLTNQLKEYLGKLLPPYMVPDHLIELKAMPLTHNGKVNLKALPAPGEVAKFREGYIAPKNETEEMLLKVWRDVLKRDDISTTDNFFEIGGHSLRATQLIAKIYREMNVELSLLDVFSHSTIVELALRIREETEGIYASISPAEIQEYYPASSAQKRLYVIEEMNPGGLAYHIPAFWLITGTFDLPAFERAIGQLVQRHEALRTSFALVNGELVQRIWPEVDCVVEVCTAAEEEMVQLQQEFLQPFDLCQAPLFRIKVVKVDAEKQYLLLDIHHIIADGVSTGILIRELMALYQDEDMPPLKLQYKDFAVWQSTVDYGDQADFWLDEFRGEIPVLNMPVDYRPTSEVQFVGDRLHFVLAPDLTRKWRDLMALNDATLFMGLLAAYNVLLAKYSGQEDVIVGVPVAGREHPALEGIIGMFVNLLPMRNQPEGEKTFSEFLAEVKERALLAYECQSYPYELLVEELHLERDVSRHPLVSTAFGLNDLSFSTLELAGLAFTRVDYLNQTAKFDLDFDVLELDETLHFELEYRVDLFKREKMEMLCQHFQELLRQIVEQPDCLLKDLDMLSPDERHELIYGFNNTRGEYQFERTLGELFREMVERHGDACAIRAEGASLTYRELDQEANLLAHKLRSCGVQRDSIVGLLLEPSPELLIGIWAILKAGGAYLPINPQYPEKRIQFMLQDSGTRVLVTRNKYAGTLEFAGTVLDVTECLTHVDRRAECCVRAEDTAECLVRADDLSGCLHQVENTAGCLAPAQAMARVSDSLVSGESDANAANCALNLINVPSDLAYVIYTSGSTGTPKGVMIEHRSLINHVYALNQLFAGEIGEADNCLSIANISFDASVQEMFLPLLFGATLVIWDPEQMLEAQGLAETIVREQITLTYVPPVLLEPLADELLQEKDVYLAKMLVGVEPIRVSTLAKFLQINPAMRILNGYGPTEATICSTEYPFTCKEMALEESVATPHGSRGYLPVGRPLTNTQVYVLNQYLEPVPVGVTGEIYLAGVGVARGYLNRSDLTAERFIANPFLDNLKMYRTGDLGKWRSDGQLEFVGRNDEQIKLRGYRIEPGEIEQLLLADGRINTVVVAVKTDRHGEKMLIAYYLSREEITPGELRTRLKAELPEYMVPTYYVRMAELPINLNGKIDRNALPLPDEMSTVRNEYIPPITEIEEKLAEIWGEILVLRQIGRLDHFFELGGHSLKAMALLARIKTDLQVAMVLRDIFRYPVLKDLAGYLEAKDRERVVEIYPAILPVQAREYYPVTAAQRRLYLAHYLEEDSRSYNMPAVLRVEGELDPAKVERAFNILLQRHASLRTSFALIDGEPVQKVHDVTCKLEVMDIDAVVAAKLEATDTDAVVTAKLEATDTDAVGAARLEVQSKAAGATMSEDVQIAHLVTSFIRPFDLQKPPLMRVGLIRLKSGQIFMLDVHHIVADGISLSILLDEFATLYAGQTVPEVRLQYTDYAVWQNELVAKNLFAKQEAYWIEQFAGELPVLNLLTDFERPVAPGFAGKSVSEQVNREFTMALNQLAGQLGVTPYMFLLAAFYTLLHKYTGQQDIIVGTTNAGRTHPETQRMVGMFVNTLALRAKPAGEKPFQKFLAEVKECVLNGFENELFPYDALVDRLALKREGGRNPLFDVMFALENIDYATGEGGGQFSQYAFETGIAKFDLLLGVREVAGELKLRLEYRTALFQEQTMVKFLEYYINILKNILSEPALLLKDVQILSENDRLAMVHKFNNTATPLSPKPVYQLFEEQVERTPLAIALVQGDEHLTYSELNGRANQLARRLQSEGVKRETRVGLFSRPTLLAVVGILAIIKAGSAYVPLDPDYPVSRLNYIIEDSELQTLLITGQIPEGVEFSGTILDLTVQTAEDWCSAEGSNLLYPDGQTPLAEDLLYTIYTSGSTGQPKGVQVENLSVLNYLLWARKMYIREEQCDFPLYSPLAFDLTVTSLFLPLISGNTILVYGAEDRELSIVKILTEDRTHVIKLTPAHLRIIKDLEVQPVNLKRLIVGGEKLTTELAAAIDAKFAGRVEIYNEYGPTEATVGCMIYRYEREQATLSVPIGVPADNVQIYVLDHELNPVGLGMAGELCIAGTGLARGYLNQPGLTAEKFVANPFTPGTLLYKTGDLARWLTGGQLEYLDRKDRQVKIRGYRIELDDIRAQLLSYPGVQDAVVLVKAANEERYERYLVAFVVGLAQAEISELSQYLSERLPEYMLPTYLMPLAELPLTPNGKVDLKALENSATVEVFEQVEYVAPETEVEKYLTDLFAEILRVERFGLNDNFFTFAGDSIKAIRIAARAQQHGIHVTVKDIFMYKTVAGLIKNLNLPADLPTEESNPDSLKPAQQPTETQATGSQPARDSESDLDEGELQALADLYKF